MMLTHLQTTIQSLVIHYMHTVQFKLYNNAEIGYTSFLTSTAAPQSTNAFTALTSPCVAARWRAVLPYCSINTSLTIILCLYNQYSFCPTSDVHVLCLCNKFNTAWLYLVSGVHCCSMLHQEVDYFNSTPCGSPMEGSLTIL